MRDIRLVGDCAIGGSVMLDGSVQEVVDSALVQAVYAGQAAGRAIVQCIHRVRYGRNRGRRMDLAPKSAQ